jgi:hypothetical protein
VAAPTKILLARQQGPDRGPSARIIRQLDLGFAGAVQKNERRSLHMSKLVEAIDHERRRLIGTAAMGIAATAEAFGPLPEHLAAAEAGQHSNQETPPMATTGADAIRPFRVSVPEEQLDAMRRSMRMAQSSSPRRRALSRPHRRGEAPITTFVSRRSGYFPTISTWGVSEASAILISAKAESSPGWGRAEAPH